MGRLLICALILSCVGCLSSPKPATGERPPVVPRPSFITQSTHDFFAKPKDDAPDKILP